MTGRPAPPPSVLSVAWGFLRGDPKPGGDADRQPADAILVVAILAFVAFGMVMVYSASAVEAARTTGSPFHFLVRQGVAAVIGLAGMGWLARLPTWRLARVGWILYVAVTVGLLLVFVPGIGQEANGAVRWIGSGSLRVQPSEFMKVALILVLAERVNRMAGGVADLKHTIVPLAAISLPPLVLVLAEPDFGTTVVLAGIVGLILVIGGARLSWMAGLGSLGVVGAIAAICSDEYRMRRVIAWIDPWKDEQGGGYQVIQSWVALHRGGLDGQGLGIAMSKMKFLPYAHTDFVAAVVGEELGFLGLVFLMALYALLIWRGVEVATRARTFHGTLLAGAVTVSLGMQTLFNLGVIMGLVPPKGLVLPFMSYGASALVAHLWSMGILLSVSSEPREAEEPVPGAGGEQPALEAP
ncbi:MAG: putative lipid II flippase FtsW [Deltaproteobacteria bacterium]|nr:putative lipid II flippase FtsW [Deltaproteobacteria bacterium]